ncbi:MAG: pitrilysin family protein [Planctomycetia bacterium]|nr:pitrilysin family protein [Planctomycetia bacterium]
MLKHSMIFNVTRPNFVSLCIFLIVFTSSFYVRADNMINQTDKTEQKTCSAQEIVSRETYPGNITVAKLANGLTIIVQENHAAPVATVRCAVKNTGSMHEGKYLGAGLSHVLEHVVAGGSTTKRSEAEIRQIVDTFGGITNAYTSLDITNYLIDCPSKNLETCIELIADSMQHAAFVTEEFDREMNVIQQELADGEVNRQRVMWKMLSEQIYLESPARVPIIGYLDVLKQVTREQIIEFYREKYVPNNQIFVVVGDVDTDKVLQQVATEFAGTPRGMEDDGVLPQEPPQASPRFAVREMDGNTTDITLAWPSVRLQDNDMYALDVLSYILSAGDSSRMVRDMLYEKQLVLSVGTYSVTPSFDRGYFAVRMSVLPDKAEEAIQQALRHVYATQKSLVSEKELEKAKKIKAAERVFGRQTVQQAAEDLIHSYMSTGTPVFDDHYVENIQKVTAEQIRHVANKYFDPEKLTTIKIVPKGYKDPQEAKIREKDSVSDIHLVTLENGVKVLTRRMPQLPLVEMKIYALGGNLADSRKTAGRSTLLCAMLDKGTKKMTAEQIAEYFDSIGGGISFSAGRNTISGSISVLKEDFPKAMSILADCVLSPVFPEDKFQQTKSLLLGMIERRSADPRAELMELFADSLPETTPYAVLSGGKKETLEALTTADLAKFYKELLVGQNITISVFGDIQPEEAVQLVRSRFAAIPASEKPATPFFDRPNKIETQRVHKTTQKDAGMVMLAYAAPNIFEKEDYAALDVLCTIMAGYRYGGSSWLFTELRGEGLVYSVQGAILTGPAPGYMIFLAQTAPDKVDEIIRRFQKNVERAKTGQITEEEFLIAKEMMIAANAQENTTAGEQATITAINELFGLGYDYDKTFAERIEKVTLEEVKAAAEKYFQNPLVITTSNQPEK